MFQNNEKSRVSQNIGINRVSQNIGINRVFQNSGINREYIRCPESELNEFESNLEYAKKPVSTERRLNF